MDKAEIISRLKNIVNEGKLIHENYPKKSHLQTQIRQMKQSHKTGDHSGFAPLILGDGRASRFAVSLWKNGYANSLHNQIEQATSAHSDNIRNADTKIERLFSQTSEILTSLAQTNLLRELIDAKSLSRADLRILRLASVGEKAILQFETVKPELLVGNSDASPITAAELLMCITKPKVKINTAPVAVQQVDFTKADNVFEDDVAGFFKARGFDVACAKDSPADFVAVANTAKGPIILVGECQTNYSTREHLDKLYTAARKIQQFCNERKVNGVLQDIYLINFEAKMVARDLRELCVGRHGVLVDKILLIKMSILSTPEEIYKFLTENLYTALTARF